LFVRVRWGRSALREEMKEADGRGRGLGLEESRKQRLHARTIAGREELVGDHLQGVERACPLSQALLKEGSQEEKVPAFLPRGLLLQGAQGRLGGAPLDETVRHGLRLRPAGIGRGEGWLVPRRCLQICS